MRIIFKILFLVLIVLDSKIVYAEDDLSQVSDEQAHEIVLNGTPEDVKKLLQTGYDVNKVYQCNTLLVMAIKSAAQSSQMVLYPSYALEKVKILVDTGADINFVPCSEKSMPSLSWAVSLPSLIENTEVLAYRVIDDKIKSGVGECIIPTVVSKPCKDITPVEREKIRKALHSSFLMKNRQLVPYFMEIVTYLVNKGANLNGSGEHGNKVVPIYLAAINPQNITIEPLKYLIKAGADIDIQDGDGNTPLFYAFGAGNQKAVNLLIEAGADVNVMNKEGVLFNEVVTKKMFGFSGANGNFVLKDEYSID